MTQIALVLFLSVAMLTGLSLPLTVLFGYTLIFYSASFFVACAMRWMENFLDD